MFCTYNFMVLSLKMDKRDNKVSKTTRWEEKFLEVLMGPQTPKLDESYIERRMDDRMKDNKKIEDFG